ncbi:MAG: sigma-70 family RNA polymerase sigma factor [Candidatus Eremiobacteraeota bacterium]|nr:sigma-70 family RNA polymerase sigma factor [Candidatus Eremiobacteraeota bacterium]
MPLNLERGLIESAKSGGADLERLITAVWPEAYRLAFSILRDGGLAEDSAQEACASIARSLSALKNTAVFPAWSYRIIVNHAITAARRRPRTQTLESLTYQPVHFDQSDALDLYTALAALPPVQRGATILHYYAGLDSGEIAAATGLPRSTVRFHLMLARRALRKALSTTDTHTLRSSKEALSDVHG